VTDAKKALEKTSTIRGSISKNPTRKTGWGEVYLKERATKLPLHLTVMLSEN